MIFTLILKNHRTKKADQEDLGYTKTFNSRTGVKDAAVINPEDGMLPRKLSANPKKKKSWIR